MMDTEKFVQHYLNGLKDLFDRFDSETFHQIVSRILNAYHHGNYIFTMGNGGSGSTASHFVCDINKGCCLDLEKKFKMICLNDNMPSILALANDVSYESVFIEPLKNFFNPGDLVIGISGSGNSQNILNALSYAKENGGITIGLTGFSGGKLASLAEIAYVADIDDMQKVEDLHMILIHMIMQAIDGELHPGKSA
jgi:D-sedoheptulose 7-phosphate isomerase